MKQLHSEQVRLGKIVGGGQAMGSLADGRKVFVWGGLPGETAQVRLVKTKRAYAEGIATDIITASADRVAPKDPDSYLSTSPWQIMNFKAEQQYKAQLIEEAFALHHSSLPHKAMFFSGDAMYGYRNKVEFSWYWNNDKNQLDLSFFRRGTHGKIPVSGTALAMEPINLAAREIRDYLRTLTIEARPLKTLMLRCDQAGEVHAQLYLNDKSVAVRSLLRFDEFVLKEARSLELIYSDPKSPASVISQRLGVSGTPALSDQVLGTDFHYAVESFFQVNLPVYEQSLRDMQGFIPENTPVVDFYSGVGSIGLTIGGNDATLIESNEQAVAEMRRNIAQSDANAVAVLAKSEESLHYITKKTCVILDPPRAGLHTRVIQRLLEEEPKRIIYLSCNPVTQARDYALLAEGYKITHQQGYNFFPRTPHIENLLVIERR